MKIWTANCTGYEMAKEIKRGDYEDVSPYGVYSDRDGAVSSVVKFMNEEIIEHNDQVREDEEGEFVSSITADSLKWEDCHTYGGTKRWKTFCEFDENWYIITELELDSDD